jgi:hypothetical protein
MGICQTRNRFIDIDIAAALLTSLAPSYLGDGFSYYDLITIRYKLFYRSRHICPVARADSFIHVPLRGQRRSLSGRRALTLDHAKSSALKESEKKMGVEGVRGYQARLNNRSAVEQGEELIQKKPMLATRTWQISPSPLFQMRGKRAGRRS